MNKGSPGGILLIAFGVLFLRLAYTGRIGAVWQALLTGDSPDDTSRLPETDPSKFQPGGTRGNWSCPKENPLAVWGCDGEKLCRSERDESQSPIVCKNTNVPNADYYTYNAAGAPYRTSAGNTL